MKRIEKIDRCIIYCVLKGHYQDAMILIYQAIEEREQINDRKKKARKPAGKRKQGS